MSRYAEAHQNPTGPGDARPTALQIIKDQALENKWVGKNILVTGTSSGIGIETARAFAATGATVYATARDVGKAEKALSDIVSAGKAHVLELDLNSLESVRSCARDLLSRVDMLHVLVANAGIMIPPEGRTVDGFETQLGVNHLAHFLLFNLLKDAMIRSAEPDLSSRVIFLTSSGHRIAPVNFDDINFKKTPYNEWVAYGQSKTAMLWTANQIERLYGSSGIHALSVMPGGIFSGLQKNIPDGGQAMFAGSLHIFKSPEQGASTTLWAATAKELEGVGAKYIEDCEVQGPAPEGDNLTAAGYAPWAFDETNEERLWGVSLEMVGLKA
jgi:NAD(P)-dependent dehydrogenase (short-subunit alcohol dehydrogenase family)